MAGNSFQTQTTLKIGEQTYHYHSLALFEKNAGISIEKLPFSMKILLENMLRQEDGVVVQKKDILAVAHWDPKALPNKEIQFMPARVLLQDFTGVPCVADLAAMRQAMKKLGKNPGKINPLINVDLVIDHSVQVDHAGSSDAQQKNLAVEFERNQERYEFLKWAQSAFENFRVVPPATGIVHQVNLEYLASVAMVRKIGNQQWVLPDSLVGTDSHTTMINGLGCLAWGVGGIEAEAAMLGQPCSMLIPQVVGVKLTGKLADHVTATDLVLTVTQILRKKGVVGKFVEFFGPGLAALSLADRATVANMAPEYGATIGIFPVDAVSIAYLVTTNRQQASHIAQAYYQAQGLLNTAQTPAAVFSDTVELDLATVSPSLAGPSRPQDRIELSQVKTSFRRFLAGQLFATGPDKPKLEAAEPWILGKHPFQALPGAEIKAVPVRAGVDLEHGKIVIAAITSCTNTSNPSVLIGAGLIAKAAVLAGLKSKPWVKTSLAPGSQVVKDYLHKAGLLEYLEALGFHLVGYGCTTCIGNSGPLADDITKAIVSENLAVAAVLSGNRNFEGRVHLNVRANFLASPGLVVAYALAGHIDFNMETDPLGVDKAGNPIFLKDLWPKRDQVDRLVNELVTSQQFAGSYADVFKGPHAWQAIETKPSELYAWNQKSTYIKQPVFLNELDKNTASDIHAARVLAVLGDSITTDHISPAGSISKTSDSAKYLTDLGVKPEDFNSYGARRGNHELMVRGTFGSTRLKNKLAQGKEGSFTHNFVSNKMTSIFEASLDYQAKKIPLVILAGKEYGTGSSRDWAAKGPKLLGVRAVIAESFERIHRSNLVGMGILALQFINNQSAESLGLTGKEVFHIKGLTGLTPGSEVIVQVEKEDGKNFEFATLCRIDTPNELEYFKNDGILPYVLKQIAQAGA
jgi:aconitate hydratase